MKRVLVCGGRDFADSDLLDAVLGLLHHEQGIEWIIHGAARGADSLAGRWAEKNRIPVDPYPADWKKHGKKAGPIRNTEMLSLGMPDLVIAFPGGRGTADMTAKARAAGVDVLEVRKDAPSIIEKQTPTSEDKTNE